MAEHRVTRGSFLHMVGVSRFPRRCRRALPTSPDWRCPAGRDVSTAATMRLDTARPGWFPPGDDSDEGTGTQATNTRTAAEQPDVRRPPVAEARRRPAVDLRCPPNAADSRPHDACAVTRTAAFGGHRRST